jgi:hypothetical protein
MTSTVAAISRRLAAYHLIASVRLDAGDVTGGTTRQVRRRGLPVFDQLRKNRHAAHDGAERQDNKLHIAHPLDAQATDVAFF